MDDNEEIELLKVLREEVALLTERLVIESAVNSALAAALTKAGAFEEAHVAALRGIISSLPEITARGAKLANARLEGLSALVDAHGHADTQRKLDS